MWNHTHCTCSTYVSTKTSFIIFLVCIMTMVLSSFTQITSVRAEFDIKATLLSHRESHANHIQKEVAYDHFRLLDQQRIRKLEELIVLHERQLQQSDIVMDDTDIQKIRVAKLQLSKLVSESDTAKKERYAELHEAIQSDHTLGIADLDFTRTGLS